VPALSLDLAVEQGTTWAHGFIPKINGQPVLAAGWTARAQARITVPAPEVLHEWSIELGNINIDLTTGAVTMLIAPVDSSPWAWRKAYYDLEIISPDGTITYRVVQGKIRVSPEVTRD
jgi:hypothetical protein